MIFCKGSFVHAVCWLPAVFPLLYLVAVCDMRFCFRKGTFQGCAVQAVLPVVRLRKDREADARRAYEESPPFLVKERGSNKMGQSFNKRASTSGARCWRTWHTASLYYASWSHIMSLTSPSLNRREQLTFVSHLAQYHACYQWPLYRKAGLSPLVSDHGGERRRRDLSW